jgi:hypothetical protein
MCVKELFLCKVTWVRSVDLIRGSVHRHVLWASPVFVVRTSLTNLPIEFVRAHVRLQKIVRTPFNRFASVVHSI